MGREGGASGSYPSPVCPDAYRSCTGRGPAGIRPRGPTPLLQRGPETTAAQLRGQVVRMWTRPSDRAPSYGPYGQGVDKYKALAHPLPTLAALAPTSSPLQQQRFIAKATSPAPEPSRSVPSSQAIRRRNSPVKYRGVPTGQSDKQQPASRRDARRSLNRAPAMTGCDRSPRSPSGRQCPRSAGRHARSGCERRRAPWSSSTRRWSGPKRAWVGS